MLHREQNFLLIFIEKRPRVSCVDSFMVLEKKALTKSFNAFIVRTGNEISYPIKKDLRYQEKKNPHEIFQISKILSHISAYMFSLRVVCCLQRDERIYVFVNEFL